MSEKIEQKSPKPPGLLPKQVQNYVILGVATVLIVIIWLTSGEKKPPRRDSTTANTSDSSRLNQAKLEEYRNQLAAQERLLREQQALLLGQQPPAKADEALAGNLISPRTNAAPSTNPQEALKTQLQLEQQKKDYQSLFATNLALSYRQEGKQSSEADSFKEFLKTMGKGEAGENPLQHTSGPPFPLLRPGWPAGYAYQWPAPETPAVPSPATQSETQAAADTVQKATGSSAKLRVNLFRPPNSMD